MLFLNLLPPQNQKKYWEQKIFILLKNVSLIFFLFVLFVTFSSFSAYYFLHLSFQNIKNNQDSMFSQKKKINKEISDSNKMLSRIKVIQNNYVQFSKLLLFLSDITPSSIVFKKISLDNDFQKKKIIKIKLQGVAKDRKSLIKYKDRLNQSPFGETILPFSNLLEQKNITFNLETTIDYSLFQSQYVQ